MTMVFRRLWRRRSCENHVQEERQRSRPVRRQPTSAYRSAHIYIKTSTLTVIHILNKMAKRLYLPGIQYNIAARTVPPDTSPPYSAQPGTAPPF